MAITYKEKLTDICNLALAKIGQYSLPSIDHDREEAKHCRLHLPQVRQKLLRMHAWNFATRFALLEENETLFDVKWAKRFNLPCDYMQLITAWHDGTRQCKMSEFNIVANSLLTENAGAYIEYTADEVDARCWDASFTDCVTTALAAELAIPIAGSQRLRAQFMEELQSVCLPQAHLNNAWEDASNENNSTAKRMRESSLINQNNYTI